MKADRWAVMISGTGSNLQALLDLVSDPFPRVVYSSQAQAPGLKKAQRFGVSTVVLPSPLDWSALHQDLKSRRIQKIFLLGFMKILPADFLRQWKGRILNLHPSLLPLYPGLKSFERAYHDGASLGATLHMVNEILDGGEILLQRRFSRGVSESETRLRLSWTEQSLVREIFERE